MALNGNLEFFGLKQTPYILEEVENEDDMIVSIWNIPNSNYGKIMLSQKDKQLSGLISFDTDGNILSKQFFEEYSVINGFEFPNRIVQYIYVLSKKTIKLTTYRNIKINELESDQYYDYPIPDIN